MAIEILLSLHSMHDWVIIGPEVGPGVLNRGCKP